VPYFRRETHPLTCMMQNYDADILRTHGLRLATALKLIFRLGGFSKIFR